MSECLNGTSSYPEQGAQYKAETTRIMPEQILRESLRAGERAYQRLLAVLARVRDLQHQAKAQVGTQLDGPTAGGRTRDILVATQTCLSKYALIGGALTDYVRFMMQHGAAHRIAPEFLTPSRIVDSISEMQIRPDSPDEENLLNLANLLETWQPSFYIGVEPSDYDKFPGGSVDMSRGEAAIRLMVDLKFGELASPESRVYEDFVNTVNGMGGGGGVTDGRPQRIQLSFNHLPDDLRPPYGVQLLISPRGGIAVELGTSVIDSSGDVDAPEPQNLLYFMALSKNGADLKAWERVAMGYEGDDLQSVGYATAEQMIKYGPPINPPSEAPL